MNAFALFGASILASLVSLRGCQAVCLKERKLGVSKLRLRPSGALFFAR